MPASHKEQFVGKIFPKGQVVIPAAVRKKYKIEIGDQIMFTLSNDGIMLKPVPATHSKGSLTEKLFGIYASHRTSQEKLSAEEITMATEAGFTKKWRE
jgi:AbrB family looped-hinge helix DNA binding protein